MQSLSGVGAFTHKGPIGPAERKTSRSAATSTPHLVLSKYLAAQPDVGSNGLRSFPLLMQFPSLGGWFGVRHRCRSGCGALDSCGVVDAVSCQKDPLQDHYPGEKKKRKKIRKKKTQKEERRKKEPFYIFTSKRSQISRPEACRRGTEQWLVL